MLKYFSHKDNLSDVLKYIEDIERPKVILAEYNCLIDKRMVFRDDGNDVYTKEYVQKIIKCRKTIAFNIVDNKTYSDVIEDGLKQNYLYDDFIGQERAFVDFTQTYSDVLTCNNSLWQVKLNDFRKNNLLHSFIDYMKTTDSVVVILFSYLYDAISFMLVHEPCPNVEIIVFDIHTQYTHLKSRILNIFDQDG